MAKTVRLRHVLHRLPKYIEYFYDTQFDVIDGVITVPTDNPTWLQRAWTIGYNTNPETNELVLDWTTLLDADSAKSAGDKTDEGSNGGRQPANQDGVRSGEPTGGGSDAGQGLGSGIGSGAAVEETPVRRGRGRPKGSRNAPRVPAGGDGSPRPAQNRRGNRAVPA